jgi:3-hydroxyisobutyrate dehydrogenase
MAFAKAENLPLDKLIDTLGKGAGSSWYLVNRAPNMVREAYPPGFRVRLHQKDLNICHDMAARHGVQLPVIEMTLHHYRRLIEMGFGDEDISTLFRLKDAMFKGG